MVVVLAALISVVFLMLGLVHFSWVLGGSWGLDAALPTKENGERVLNPGKADSAVVGCGLTIFGSFYFLQTGWLPVDLPVWIFVYGGWIIPSVFILRAIGDFRYVGFFKTIRSTTFGRQDTRFFSPLCLFIGMAGFIFQVIR